MPVRCWTDRAAQKAVDCADIGRARRLLLHGRLYGRPKLVYPHLSIGGPMRPDRSQLLERKGLMLSSVLLLNSIMRAHSEESVKR